MSSKALKKNISISHGYANRDVCNSVCCPDRERLRWSPKIPLRRISALKSAPLAQSTAIAPWSNVLKQRCENMNPKWMRASRERCVTLFHHRASYEVYVYELWSNGFNSFFLFSPLISIDEHYEELITPGRDTARLYCKRPYCPIFPRTQRKPVP